ncbi:hypothetical protein CHLRE_01g039626v5 [Chlamydomonas reinhardtii]|uniref:Uncharacterized protein n=1 Tax=Chlamydomonas reinhardtii TaxID=3055 RepID=A0A2K3E7A9_CHLRE|nr:uncharacterized protein CHLRE_01g039626v5 [Chlamydomonas reinhardtii]PNW88669.1 hypothetical protein CHLRE_01g039626v5 [Chlamydomonas reinhardtii]
MLLLEPPPPPPVASGAAGSGALDAVVVAGVGTGKVEGVEEDEGPEAALELLRWDGSGRQQLVSLRRTPPPAPPPPPSPASKVTAAAAAAANGRVDVSSSSFARLSGGGALLQPALDRQSTSTLPLRLLSRPWPPCPGRGMGRSGRQGTALQVCFWRQRL